MKNWQTATEGSFLGAKCWWERQNKPISSNSPLLVEQKALFINSKCTFNPSIPLHVWLHAMLGLVVTSCLFCISLWSPEPVCSPLGDPLHHTFIQSLIQLDTVGMSARSPLTLYSAQTYPASLMGALCQAHCEKLLISRLQKASSALTKRGRALRR